MKVEWDPVKATTNLRKHGVSFERAAEALRDPMAVTLPDPDHSVGEMRLISVGNTPAGQLLTIAHTDRATAVRLISARKSTPDERSIYEEQG